MAIRGPDPAKTGIGPARAAHQALAAVFLDLVNGPPGRLSFGKIPVKLLESSRQRCARHPSLLAAD
jgi:hypothetical protein